MGMGADISKLILCIIALIFIVIIFIIETMLGNIVVDPVITTVDTTITHLLIDESTPFHDSLNMLFISFGAIGILITLDGLLFKFEVLRLISEIFVGIASILSSLFSR
ncbi:MAG: hypothetical protein PHR89_04895 [Bacilli bacterium]|nr:hypothetical protein [Bacilli bacterium]